MEVLELSSSPHYETTQMKLICLPPLTFLIIFISGLIGWRPSLALLCILLLRIHSITSRRIAKIPATNDPERVVAAKAAHSKHLSKRSKASSTEL